MKQLFFTINLIVALALVSCNTKTEPKQEMTETSSSAPQKIDIKLSDLATDQDYVCGMTIGEGAIADTTSYEGKLYGFCSPECKEEFLKNPTSYLAQK